MRPATAIAGADAGPLAGLRFAIKDNIDAAGWPTTAACPAFEYTAPAHAAVVQRLLDDRGAETLGGSTVKDHWAAAGSNDEARRDILLTQLDSLRVRRGVVGRYFDEARVLLVWRGASSGE